MTVANLLEVLGAMTGSLIIVADMDWKRSAKLKYQRRRGKTYFRDVPAQYRGDPRSREHQRLA